MNNYNNHAQPKELETYRFGIIMRDRKFGDFVLYATNSLDDARDYMKKFPGAVLVYSEQECARMHEVEFMSRLRCSGAL